MFKPSSLARAAMPETGPDAILAASFSAAGRSMPANSPNCAAEVDVPSVSLTAVLPAIAARTRRAESPKNWLIPSPNPFWPACTLLSQAEEDPREGVAVIKMPSVNAAAAVMTIPGRREENADISVCRSRTWSRTEAPWTAGIEPRCRNFFGKPYFNGPITSELAPFYWLESDPSRSAAQQYWPQKPAGYFFAAGGASTATPTNLNRTFTTGSTFIKPTLRITFKLQCR